MDVEHALLTSLHDDPADEASWLVLADFLEEGGQPERAELLRLHRRLRHLPEDGADRLTAEASLHQMLRAGVKPCVPLLTNSVGMQLALIPAGRFLLGSPEDEKGRYSDESPRRRLELTRPFYLGVFPVTQAEYQQVAGRNPSYFSATGPGRELIAGKDTRRHPVENVSWAEAVAFCQALSGRPEEKEAGRTYRLPTEYEWEYACRGGSASLSTPFPFGRSMTLKLANFRGRRRTDSTRPRHTSRVDRYRPNAFGLYDMLGNVWEWCADWYSGSAYADAPACDPPGPGQGDRRNARGGTFSLETRRVRSADRSSFEPEHRDRDLGFRVLCQWHHHRAW